MLWLQPLLWSRAVWLFFVFITHRAVVTNGLNMIVIQGTHNGSYMSGKICVHYNTSIGDLI